MTATTTPSRLAIGALLIAVASVVGIADVASPAAAAPVEGRSSVSSAVGPAIATGGHTCAILNTGDVACFGGNYVGQLGNATDIGITAAHPTPLLVDLPTDTTATAITAGIAHACAILNTGDVICWGDNYVGQLGNATNSGSYEAANPTPLPVTLPTDTTATAITAGNNHTCAILNTGDVTCWGDNHYGQLGNTTNSGSYEAANPTPLPVTLPTDSTATTITAGGNHTCVIVNTGDVTCWGWNVHGQLGNTTNNDTNAANPTPLSMVLPTDTTATTITAGNNHTCAVLNTGDVTCWGENLFGQLGATTDNAISLANPTPQPVALPAGTTATAVTAGERHTCAISSSGDVMCWGDNRSGQLGNTTNVGTTNANLVPLLVALPAGTTAIAVTAGHSHTCAVLNTGDVTCWGWNYAGQLGNTTNSGTHTPTPTPLPAALPTGTAATAAAIAAGDDHTCAISNTGEVTCWGWNHPGQLGNTTNTGTNTPHPTPQSVTLPTGTTATTITAGGDHTCAILNTGDVTCWGSNDAGQLGNTTNNGNLNANPTPQPVALPAGTTAIAITAGHSHTCAVLNTGDVACWGDNYSGQLGNTTGSGTFNANPTPLPVALPTGTTATTINAGYGHTCAILNTGDTFCWGNNHHGQLGNTTNSGLFVPNPTPLPVTLPSGTTATSITAGFSHTCAISNTGEVTCWGHNYSGQLGNTTNTGTSNANPTPLPVALPTGTTATAITAGDDHTCAISNTGDTFCWGYNHAGQLGNGDTVTNSAPSVVALPAGTTATAITAGTGHTCSISNTGDTFCWGNNHYGQLGNTTGSGTFVANPTPLIVGLAGAPTIGTATADDATATVSWTPGAPSAFGDVTGYRIEQSTDAGGTWTPAGTTIDSTTSTATSATITGLTNDTPVEFRVRAINAVGDSNPSASSGTVTPTPQPTVSIVAAGGQADPTNQTPIAFTATFSHLVTGFDAGDIGLSAPAGATASVTAVSGSDYTITVAGMTSDGTITVSIPAGAAINANGQANTASNTSTIAYDTTGPVATIDLAPTQQATTTATPVAYSITFDQPVTDFTISDIAIAGTAGPTDATLTGSGTDYTLTIAQASITGTITATIAAGAATDTVGNPSTTTVINDTITITDTTGPVIDVPATPIEADTDPGKPDATVTYTVTATDPTSDGTTFAAFGGTLTPTCTPASGAQFPIGTTTVTCTATDTDDNTSTASFLVIVTDNERPVITGANDQTHTLAAGNSGPITYAMPSATDNSGTATTTCTPAIGANLTAGNHTITCTSTDPSSNTTTATFTLTVDATPPMSDLPATGNSELPWKPALALIATGIALFITARRRRHSAAA